MAVLRKNHDEEMLEKIADSVDAAAEEMDDESDVLSEEATEGVGRGLC